MSIAGQSAGYQTGLGDLAERVSREVLPALRTSSSPSITADDANTGVALLFDLLAHRPGDPELDAVGADITTALERWLRHGELVKLADRYEPFCKFVLSLTNPSKYRQLQAETGNRLAAAKVLKALDLVNNKSLSTFESCSWENFPPADVVGQPDFLEHVARTYVFRNVDDHQARELSQREKAQVAESFCVFLVWCVLKFRNEIASALRRASFSIYLQGVQDRFASAGTKFVALTTEMRSQEEYRFLDPLSPLPASTATTPDIEAGRLPEANHVTVIEAEPGAGKTSTLHFLAWREAKALLSGQPGVARVPVFLELKQLTYQSHTIEAAIRHALTQQGSKPPPIPWDSLLLLADGLNEVSAQAQTDFKNEIRDLIAEFPCLHVVVAGRPNCFHGEFAASLVVLRRLDDKKLFDLFRTVLPGDAPAFKLFTAVTENPFLSAWSRTPFHAALIASFAHNKGVAALQNHSSALRYFVRSLLRREAHQSPDQTLLTKKERLLAALAFDTRSVGHLAFSETEAINILAKAKAKLAAASLDPTEFIQETLDNNLLQRPNPALLEFAHELYHDYFTACELETREQMQSGLGVAFAVQHFTHSSWHECIRLFGSLTGSETALIEQGAEQNPLLAWQLLRENHPDDPRLREAVALAAYSALECDLRRSGNAQIAGACLPILADLGRSDLLEQAIIRQQDVLEPKRLRQLPDQERAAEIRRIQESLVPLGLGLISILRLGDTENKLGKEGRFCDASRAAIRALKQIKAARPLAAILASWTGKIFTPDSLIPGAILDALIALGVDEVLDNENELLNKVLVEWLTRAAEANHESAWPALGRTLRLASRAYVVGIAYEPAKALCWLRKAHDAGIEAGSLELALFLLDEPKLAADPNEGQRLIQFLAAKGHKEAIYEIADRLCSNNKPEDEARGFELFLSLAKEGHYMGWHRVAGYWSSWWEFQPEAHLEMPPGQRPLRPPSNQS